MTVRWKPLLVLSGLFVVIAVVGVVAIASKLLPRGAADILPAARAERAAHQYERAKIHYQRALQLDGRNAAIHEELAAMYGDWADRAPAEKQAEIRAWRLASLAEAVKYGKSLKEPRRQLLNAAMTQDELPESAHWAGEILSLEPANPDAHFVLADLGLQERNPAIPEIRRHLAALESGNAPEVRRLWIEARTAQAVGDLKAREDALAAARPLALPADASPVDRFALLRLRALDVETTAEPARLGDRVQALQAEARALASNPSVASNRIMRMSLVLEQVQQALTLAAANGGAEAKPAVTALVDGIEQDVETIFQQSLAAASKIDLHIPLTYAEHLRNRGRRDRCLEVVAQALESPLAKLATAHQEVMSLHAVAVSAALADTTDDERFDKSAPHVKALLGSSTQRFQGFGHLFQGAIEFERTGLGAPPAARETVESAKASPSVSAAAQAKLRSSALKHLELAASLLPNLVEAQARYGVALVLTNEQNLGRQYLQSAMRLGNAEPQYQIWAAWSMVQAGFPEEAEPIVNFLLGEVSAGRLSRDLEGTLLMLSGEILQARRSPEDLAQALAAYDRSTAGKPAPAAAHLRMAQIDIQLGRPEEALKRIEKLRATGKGGPPAEHLAVLVLLELDKKAEAEATLAKARARFPESDELVGLEAALLAREKKPKDADRILAEFLARDPNNTSVVLMRSQLLAEQLDDVKEARRLLINAAEGTDNSSPLVQLALLDLKRKDYGTVAATVRKIRARWKEAAVADLLDAQLALEQGKSAEAVSFFDAALVKDPGNKLVQFWKAQIESRAGSSTDAARTFEAIAGQRSSKEIENGLTLAAAAQSALANLDLRKGDVDSAILRFETLRKGGTLGSLARGDRWQLAAAYAVKNQWPSARKEIASILNDPKDRPSNDERVRAANFYRQNKEDAAAQAQLDYVLGQEPTNPGAVVTRSYMLAEAKKTAEAAALIRRAIDAPRKEGDDEKPPAVFYLMLAALENVLPPAADSSKRALDALDRGLTVQPKALELVQAKYRLLLTSSSKQAAVAYVDSEAKDDAKGSIRRLLADVYRDHGDLDNSEKVLRELSAKSPSDATLAAALVRVTAMQSSAAGERGDRARERNLLDKTGLLVREFRAKFPTDVVFLQEECELAVRRGDMAKAQAITKEIDKVAKSSPAGPLLRARLYAAQGRTRDVADAYSEALDRNPNQPDVRVSLGQTFVRLGQPDEAMRQAKLVLDANPERLDAVLLEARILGLSGGSDARASDRREQAVALVNAVIERNPKLAAAYHLLAEIRLTQNQTDAALAALRACLEAVPDDPIAIAQSIEFLARPSSDGQSPAADKLAAARSLADAVDKRDADGGPTLALAIGFHKAEQLDLALLFIEKAEKKLDTPVVHLNHGDILLSLAEHTEDSSAARAGFLKAIEQYDMVLRTQANSIEAVNNKAWILLTYLGESKKALELANDLLARVDPSTLPVEFFDTMGAIQEAVGKPRDAEESYTKGLRKSPDHPILNYHMGKLVLADARRSGQAKDYFAKALAGRSRLTPSMAAEVATLMHKVSGN